MTTHRWWLALVAALLTPWIGPHMDSYVPVGWVLWRAGRESPDPGFWLIAGLLLTVAWLAWLGLITGVAAWLRRRRGAAANRNDVRP